MAITPLKDGFEIHEHRRDDDSYMYSDTDFEFSVTIDATGDELFSFSGSWYQSRGGDSREGVSSVSFSDEGDAVIAHNFDGTVERHPLPVDVKIVDSGKKIAITWPDGRVEERERKQGIFVTKYGQPFYVRELLGKPKKKK